MVLSLKVTLVFSLKVAVLLHAKWFSRKERRSGEYNWFSSCNILPQKTVLIFMAHVIAHFEEKVFAILSNFNINFTPSMGFVHKPFKNTISTWYGFILFRKEKDSWTKLVYILSQITSHSKQTGKKYMVMHQTTEDLNFS